MKATDEKTNVETALEGVSDSKTHILKEIQVEADFRNNVYELIVQSFSNNKIGIKLNLPPILCNQLKNDHLNVICRDIKISREIVKDMVINNLPKGDYKLYINNSPLIKFGIK